MEVITLNDQLFLRGLREQDAARLFQIVENERARLREFLTWVDVTFEEKDCLNFVLRTHRRRKEKVGVTFGIWSEGELFGVIGYNMINGTDAWGEIGYWVSQHIEGRGIATESCRALVDLGFEHYELNRVVIRCATNNKRSEAIPKKLGFTLEGTLRECTKLRDDFVSANVFSLLRSEWRTS